MQIRPTQLTINLSALRDNLRQLKTQAKEAEFCAVVKANAYGHGAVEVGRFLQKQGVRFLAVALVEEAIQLRQAGIQTALLVLSGALEGGYDALVEYRLTPVIFSAEHLRGFANAAQGRPLAFHLKLDTGMARLGLIPNELSAFLNDLARFPNLQLEGLLTHFANADLGDRQFNAQQLTSLTQVQQQLEKVGKAPRWLHIANSAAVLDFPAAHMPLVRPGLALYGINPFGRDQQFRLHPILKWSTRAVHIKNVPAGTRVSYGGRWIAPRKSRIATLPVGYADGYMRRLSGQARVLVGGKKVPVVGTICMDLCMIDVTDVPAMTLQDEVVLLGDQGDERVTTYDLAEWAQTIPYEIVCAIGARVPRHYVGGED